jgi:hypothetical protein
VLDEAEMVTGVEQVKVNINAAYGRFRVALIALSLQYAGKALQLFRTFQTFNSFWNNQTFAAYNTVFTQSEVTDTIIGFFISHKVSYGVYLELANDRKHESLRIVMAELADEYYEKVGRLYGSYERSGRKLR